LQLTALLIIANLGVPLRVGLFAAIFFLPQAQHKKSISAAIPNAKLKNTKFKAYFEDLSPLIF
jgi:hypothetical protein